MPLAVEAENRGVPPRPDPAPYRVMVVEDSLVIRGLIVRLLNADPAIEVVRAVGNGREGVRSLEDASVEVVVLDIEMPVMDGMTALPLMLARDPDLKIVMASTLTQRNADITLEAMAAGAADSVAKPSTSRDVLGAEDFRKALVEKVKALGAARRRRRGRPAPTAEASDRPAARAAATVGPPVALRPMPRQRPTVLAIGSSTGGPQALMTVLKALGRVSQPILVTQHMPPTFTRLLAEHLERATGRRAVEAADGMKLEAGGIYVAPGDAHLTVHRAGAGLEAALDHGPPENCCRPSVDPMLRSLSRTCGRDLLVLILTGMGSDGLAGARVAVDAGGSVIAQDEASSVVWGMPGAVARAGLCSAVLPIGEIGERLAALMGKGTA